MLYFKVLDGKKSCHGGEAEWKIGKWMPKTKVDPCSSGYHLCRPQDLVYWLGNDIYIAEGRGKMVECDDKVVFEEARIVRRVKAWDDKSARLFSCWCVRQIWHLLKDERSKNAVRVAEKFAKGKATQEELSAALAAAREAAWEATWEAAWEATWEATWEAAWEATWEAARAAAREAAWEAARAAAREAAWEAARAAQTKKLMRVLGIKLPKQARKRG